MRSTLKFSAFLLSAALSACTETEIVYEERPPFNEPADAASGFLGYYTSATQQTTCGNCHADFQGSWAETGHAGAYATLKAVNAAASCYSCHTVNERGNEVTGVAGHDKVQDSTYYDVQCESCHGPGLEHVEGVNSGQLVRPLASIAVEVDGDNGCAACHNGTHHPFVEQWAVSRHAIMEESPQTNPSCVKCHEGRGKLAALGVQSNYAEKDDPVTEPQPITCAVCHAPHGTSNPANLRLSVSDPDPAANLCMSCHLNRVEPTGGSSRGNQPHGPQGGVLLGFAGWRPPNFAYDTARIFGSHATSANPKLCAGCHVNQFTVNDPQSGNFAFQSVGHQFEAAPCVDAQGVPTGQDDCAFTNVARNWSSCTNSGCHANEDVAANLFNATRGNIEAFAAVLWVDTDQDQTIDNHPADEGYLPRIKAETTDLNPSDNVVTGADGMEFNVRLCAEGRHGHPDGSFGTHNKFLCEALLVQGAAYLKSVYAFLPAPPANVARLAEQWSRPIPPGPGRPQIKREKFPVMK